MKLKAIALILSLTASNFAFQSFLEHPNWAQAADRSYFESLAVISFIMLP
jgi:hypothetical protein